MPMHKQYLPASCSQSIPTAQLVTVAGAVYFCQPTDYLPCLHHQICWRNPLSWQLVAEHQVRPSRAQQQEANVNHYVDFFHLSSATINIFYVFTSAWVTNRICASGFYQLYQFVMKNQKHKSICLILCFFFCYQSLL